ncbi:armadillo-type protein [Tricharina praecox]|uniref:armadillo-type protein n=1 Tax=Tricharina praecox TaxID=43433 RepID=UPI00221EC73B|nr:armadillo-type protein [Tricharina praecox]KAI5852260.1 armadillo-type protein [Tricharina praecox]
MSLEMEQRRSMEQDKNLFIHEDSPDGSMKAINPSQSAGEVNTTDGAGVEEFVPLMTSKMANIGHGHMMDSSFMKHNHAARDTTKSENADVRDLLAKLQEQQRLIDQQRDALERKDRELGKVRFDPPSGRNSYNTSPAHGPGESTAGTMRSMSPGTRYPAGLVVQDIKDVNRLQSELMAAKSQINVMNEELAQTRITKHTLEQAMSHSGDDHVGLEDVSEHTLATLQSKFAQLPRPGAERADTWPSAGYDESSSSSMEFREPHSISAGPFAGASGIWGSSGKNGLSQLPSMPLANPVDLQFPGAPGRRSSGMEPSEIYGAGNRVWNTQGHRSFASQSLAGPPPISTDPRYFNSRRASYNPGAMPFTASVDRLSPSAQFNPSPIGTPLATPTGNDFSAASAAAIWGPGQTYVSTIEPLNYRRLLERSVNCNWKYIVDKIVCNNDQQASIFLQQKLKIGTAEQKHAIVDAIVAQAYQLMINRFGNFLVQRCFEHGTQDQIQGIANAIRGNTVALSMDAFGCHVIQKAFDCVPEEFKATMVSELLRRIPETVIHRYACHVWQKLFELRWAGSPPQIMKYVNEALRGMWHEVALGETGSLVVQNIFENCLEGDKRPCITEVLEYIDLIARGQFGNWCIQHICEHGAPHDRSRAIDVVIQNAPEYSMDQYASKVVEKCLKVGGNEFLDRYLDRVCEGRPDRPRIPLIDIASDQYGNYLVQWILQHASMQHREQVASHIRKHMVSLRGSKFGSRVGMLCCNPIYNRQTPGPPSPTARFNRFGFR